MKHLFTDGIYSLNLDQYIHQHYDYSDIRLVEETFVMYFSNREVDYEYIETML